MIDEENYTHEYLWRSSDAIDELITNDYNRHHHLVIPGLLITLMAFEAFVNFCGFVLLPEVWAQEKENFRGKGIDDKIKAIADNLPNFVFNPGQAPYQNIKKLFDFRNLVAHGKVHASSYKVEPLPNGSHFQWQHPWDDHISKDAVAVARENVRAFSQELVVPMREVSDHLHLHHDAYEGPLASGESTGTAS